jgi:histone acetyltransferase (RNA polymerase elongator complex component)
MKTIHPAIYPIFLSGYPCRHICGYCDAAGTSGVSIPVDLNALRTNLESWAGEMEPERERQVALYGNDVFSLRSEITEPIFSFLGQIQERGVIHSLRTSLRPDTILNTGISKLKRFKTIEMGVPSMDKSVLKQIKRGHGPECVGPALKKVQAAGAESGMQIMLGLPGATLRSDMDSAKQIISLEPDFVRLHPALVLRNTLLSKLMARSEYRPLALEDAIERTAHIYELYLEAGIPVVRCGFHLPETVRNEVLEAGPWHEAFGQRVKSRLIRNRLLKYFLVHPDEHTIIVPKNELSDALGHSRENVSWLSTRLNRTIFIKPSR